MTSRNLHLRTITLIRKTQVRQRLPVFPTDQDPETTIWLVAICVNPPPNSLHQRHRNLPVTDLAQSDSPRGEGSEVAHA